MKNEKLIEELQAYRNDYISELEFSEKLDNTLKSYSNVINLFISYIKTLKNEISYEKLKVSHFVKFLQYGEKLFIESYHYTKQENVKFKNSTKNLYIRILKKFFNYIEKESDELLDFQKLFDDQRLKFKEAARKPKSIKKEEDVIRVERYFEDKIVAAKDFKFSKKLVAYRNSILTKIAIYSAARASELVKIKTIDIKEKGNGLLGIYTIGKGNKERELLILKDYIKYELDFFLTNGIENLGATGRGKIVTRSQLWKDIKKAYRELGMDNKLNIHSLRHTCGSKIYKKTKDLHLVKNVLGHSSTATSSIYTEMHEEEVYDKYTDIYKK